MGKVIICASQKGGVGKTSTATALASIFAQRGYRKNVSSEHTEELGNPKGKAVEHFTNMLAEMRSYGQGVIVAEQIPNKISPDVIKNSSNKIIHRIVSKDDQEIIANTVGLPSSDAIYLGNCRTGYAICHKEGMIQPVIVKVEKANSKTITDKELFEYKAENKMLDINVSVLRGLMPREIDAWAVRALLSLMYHPSFELISPACHIYFYCLPESIPLFLPTVHLLSHLYISYPLLYHIFSMWTSSNKSPTPEVKS